MNNSIKFTLTAISMLAVPCALEAEFVLKLWLGQVPAHTVEFLRIIIIQSFMPIVNNVCNAAIHANGNIKALTYINGTIFLFLPVFIFVAFHFGANVLWGYGIEILGMIVVVVSATCIIKKLIPSFRVGKFAHTIIVVFTIIILSAVPATIIHLVMPEGFIRVIVVSILYLIFCGTGCWFLILSKDNRLWLKTKIQNCSYNFIR